MEYVKFGNAGLMVSRLCWGSMDFFKEPEEDAIRLVHEAFDAGINFFDTADSYGFGKSEEMLGKAIKGRRDHLVIATKLWVHMYREDPNGRGAGRYHMMRAVEDSLRRLGTDRIDLYQLHHPDAVTPVEETISTLDTLVKQGKIRYYGVSNHFAWQMAHMLGVSALHNCEPLVSIQCRYNILDRAVENEIMHFARRFNIACIPYSPLNSGLLAGRVRRGQPAPKGTRVARIGDLSKLVLLPHENLEELIYDVVDELDRMAKRNEMGMNQVALKWLLSRDWVTAPILGGHRSEQFRGMYEALEKPPLPEQDIRRIDEISDRFRYAPFQNQRQVAGGAEQKNWW